MTDDNEKPKLPTNLEELFDKQIEFCKSVFAEQEEILPMWVGQSANNEAYPVTAVFTDQEEKEEVAKTLRRIFEKFNVVRYVSMVESWMVKVDKKDAPDPSSVRPSTHPDREEVVIIFGEDSSQQMFGIFKIIREKGKKPKLSDFELKEGGTNKIGIFSDLLPMQTPRKGESLH